MSQPTTVLTDADLLAKVQELGQAPRDQIAIACGYVNAKGKPDLYQFSDALNAAHGIKLAPAGRKPKKGKPLSYSAKVAASGTVPITAGYTTLLGLEPGDRVIIGHEGGRLWLEKAPAETAAAPVVVAVDEVEELTITAPATAAEPVRELAPF